MPESVGPTGKECCRRRITAPPRCGNGWRALARRRIGPLGGGRVTLDGALEALATRAEQLAIAADEQFAVAEQLAEQVGLAYGSARSTVEHGIRSGTMLRGEVLARWEELWRGGEWARIVVAVATTWPGATLELWPASIRDRERDKLRAPGGQPWTAATSRTRREPDRPGPQRRGGRGGRGRQRLARPTRPGRAGARPDRGVGTAGLRLAA